MIYLDYSANTPADPAVLEAFCQTERMFIGKPNSTHPAGQAAQTAMARVTDGVDTMSIAPHKFYGLNGRGLPLKKDTLSSWCISLSHLTTWEELRNSSESAKVATRSWYHEQSAALSDDRI